MNFWSLLLKILGWKIYGENFISPRSVIAVAPHTSYLDGVIGFIAMKAMKIRFRTISAERLFFFPFKYVMKFALNAIPCGPHSGNSIRVATRMFKENGDVNLVICPEGHLKAVDKWSKDFYVIAKMSCVPINIAVLNFKKRKFIHLVLLIRKISMLTRCSVKSMRISKCSVNLDILKNICRTLFRWRDNPYESDFIISKTVM